MPYAESDQAGRPRVTGVSQADRDVPTGAATDEEPGGELARGDTQHHEPLDRGVQRGVRHERAGAAGGEPELPEPVDGAEEGEVHHLPDDLRRP